jgi:type I restriction enzyme S subunit
MKAVPKIGNREFIRQFLKQDCLLEYLEGLSKRTAGQDGIQMDKLKTYPFPYPPMELQNKFAAFAAEVDKSQFVARKGLKEAELILASLKQDYFG